MKFRQGKPPELTGNSKIVIEKNTLGGMINHAKQNDWPPQGFKVLPRGCFTLSMVQAMSRRGITNFWRESKKKWKFPLDLLFLLDYIHYNGDWWLYLGKE